MSAQPIVLSEISSFHIGGGIRRLEGQLKREVKVSTNGEARMVDLNGGYHVGQLYAQHFRQAAPKYKLPVLFWHGGAMSGVTWETTPDGRPGWQSFFLRQGYDVVVSDAVERGRASWAPFPEIYETSPLFRTQEDAWTLFRMGLMEGYHEDPAQRHGYEGQRFPLEAFDKLSAQFVARWTTNNERTLAAYEKLLDRVGPAIIIAHSQGGWFAQQIAAQKPEHVAAIVAIEPAGAPTLNGVEFEKASRVPHLYVWGDYCDDHAAWKGYKAKVLQHCELMRDRGGRIFQLDLPKEGIRGNSHMPMMDDNSDHVATLVADWLLKEAKLISE
ncbi:alpha/beta fold hydrolase [Rhizobium sp. NRK18]|uniref:alpha/beta fold hydrolase n=1 Tax=Rhizobium sp. NRK18 TaxID=2964667 RepID=UPI0021C473D3|nr:alpha/beta fold hydrolase [Rhizobium sp. NRK18]MCQ2006322.1 esterase [Rhizobium sp. NRK18]